MMPSLLPFGKALNRFSLIVFVISSYLILPKSQPIFSKFHCFVVLYDILDRFLWHIHNIKKRICFENDKTRSKVFLKNPT